MTRIERIVPDRMLFGFGPVHAYAPVGTVRTYGPGQHDNSCIRNEMTAVRISSACGTAHRWHGFADAFIGSDLRMHVILAPGQERDEVLMSWDTPQGS